MEGNQFNKVDSFLIKKNKVNCNLYITGMSNVEVYIFQCNRKTRTKFKRR